MMRRILAATALWLAATGAMAQAGGPRPDGELPEGPSPEGGPPRHLFISPAGEPFRGPDGFSTWLAGADTDHDGAVTLAEFRADGLRFFKRLDTNGDGVLDGFEIQAYERDIVPEITRLTFDAGPQGGGKPSSGGGGGGRRGGGRGGGGGMGGGGRGGGMGRGGGGGDPEGSQGGNASRLSAASSSNQGAGKEGAARYSLLNIPEPVTNADENLDGRVSLEEWNHAMTRRFALLDKAQTGRLTHDSLRPPRPDKKKR